MHIAHTLLTNRICICIIAKINCATTEPASLNASMTLADEDGDVAERGMRPIGSEMTRSQSQSHLKNNGASKDVSKYAMAEAAGNGNLTKNSFSSSHLNSAKLHSDHFKVSGFC